MCAFTVEVSCETISKVGAVRLYDGEVSEIRSYSPCSNWSMMMDWAL